MTHRNTPRISFIGFGEAGQAIASGLRETGIDCVAAWDILFPEQRGTKLKEAAESLGVRVASSAGDATQETAKLLGARARYVDVAVIAAIHPARHRTPLLLSGPHAEGISPLLHEMDMQFSVVGPEIGSAAAIKMIRSVMIKGMEALTLECFLAAARAGVLEEVTVSLKNNYPTLDWAKIADYNLERMASHGERRAAEMEESAATLRELGLDPLMVESTVKRQREMGAIGKKESVRDTLKSGRAAILRAINGVSERR